MDNAANIRWPTEVKAYQTIECDSRVWQELELREDDVVVGSYHKAGTTVTQQIVSQLIFNGAENIAVWQISPWLEFRLAPKEQTLEILKEQTHRRCIKTHLPGNALPISPRAKYIYVARDGRDVAWSLHHHLSNVYDDFNEAQWRLWDPQGEKMSGYPVIPVRPRDFYLEWMEQDGYPHGSFFGNVRAWRDLRGLPNVLFTHYSRLKADLAGEIVRIARFLGYDPELLKMDKIVRQCGFQYMKENSATYAPLGGKPFKKGAASFFHKGTNQRWEDFLAPEEVARYEAVARERLGEECAHWLASGRELDR